MGFICKAEDIFYLISADVQNLRYLLSDISKKALFSEVQNWRHILSDISRKSVFVEVGYLPRLRFHVRSDKKYPISGNKDFLLILLLELLCSSVRPSPFYPIKCAQTPMAI